MGYDDPWTTSLANNQITNLLFLAVNAIIDAIRRNQTVFLDLPDILTNH